MQDNCLKPHVIFAEDAERITDWLRNRKGIAIWRSIDSGHVGQTITTPARTAEDDDFPKPVSWVAGEPACIITDFADVIVYSFGKQVSLLDWLAGKDSIRRPNEREGSMYLQHPDGYPTEIRERTGTKLKPYPTIPDSAQDIADWLRNRSGIAIWMSIDSNHPHQSLATPVFDSAGKPIPKPASWVDDEPAHIITDFAEVVVSIDVAVKRFPVALRKGSNVLRTDASMRRITAAVAKAGDGAYYAFDYWTQDAVIMKPKLQILLSEWLESAGMEHMDLDRIMAALQRGYQRAPSRDVQGYYIRGMFELRKRDLA